MLQHYFSTDNSLRSNQELLLSYFAGASELSVNISDWQTTWRDIWEIAVMREIKINWKITHNETFYYMRWTRGSEGFP